MPRKAQSPPLSATMAAPGGVASVDRALSLLAMFSDAEPLLSLSELAGRTQQYKSTVLRLLASLENAHLVHRHADGRFSPGSAVARLHGAYAASFSLADVVRPSLQALVRQTRESAAFHILQGEQDLCLSRVDSPHAIRDHIQAGQLQALDLGVAGQVLKAFAGARGPRWARIRREQLHRMAGDVESELAGVAAPVFGASGELAGAVALTMPTTRLQGAHADAVARAARAITAQLGGFWPGPPTSIRGNPG